MGRRRPLSLSKRRPVDLVRTLPHEPGVYRFRDARGRVRYLGRATDLRARVSSYWGDLGERRHLGRMVAAITRIEAVACDSVHEACWLERLLLERLRDGPGLPPGNRTAGGAEVPVWLRLDPRPRTAGLTSVHERTAVEGVRWFGPYLGGLQVRRAVTGLGRVHPLGYTATALSAAGLAMAATRAVTPSDRDRLVVELTGVLSGDPAAVAQTSAALTRVRDAAARSQAYELAGRITRELAALAWVTGRQRVCRPGDGDHLVHGWSDGLLLSWTVTDGMVVDWRQQRCVAGRAEPLLAATRGDWRDFAARNAELAAGLLRAG